MNFTRVLCTSLARPVAPGSTALSPAAGPSCPRPQRDSAMLPARKNQRTLGFVLLLPLTWGPDRKEQKCGFQRSFFSTQPTKRVTPHTRNKKLTHVIDPGPAPGTGTSSPHTATRRRRSQCPAPHLRGGRQEPEKGAGKHRGRAIAKAK